MTSIDAVTQQESYVPKPLLGCGSPTWLSRKSGCTVRGHRVKPLILIAVLFLAAFSIQPLIDKTSLPLFIPRITPVWAADNSTQTNVTVPAQHEFTVNRILYTVTKVTLAFQDTNNHTIEDINTVNPASGLHYGFDRVGAQSVFNIACDDVDIYSFTFKLNYDNSSRRDILIGIQQGDLAMEQYVWTETGTDFVIRFRLNLIPEPHYPSDIDVAKQVVYQMQLYLQQMLTQQNERFSALQAANVTNSVVSMSAAIAAIVAAMLAGFGAKRRRMRPDE